MTTEQSTLPIYEAQGQIDALKLTQKIKGLEEDTKTNNLKDKESLVFTFLNAMTSAIDFAYRGYFMDKLHNVDGKEHPTVKPKYQNTDALDPAINKKTKEIAGDFGKYINKTLTEISSLTEQKYGVIISYANGFIERLDEQYKQIFKLTIEESIEKFFGTSTQAKPDIQKAAIAKA